jgi:hypothetical protein
LWVVEAIANYRATYRAMERACKAIEPLERFPGRETPRIPIARPLGPRDAEGNDTWTPTYAYSHEDIIERLEGHAGPQISWLTKPEAIENCQSQTCGADH